MKAPDKIYVDIRHPFSNEFTEMLGFESRGNSDDIEYIRKDALLEWAENWDKYKLRTDDGFLYAMELLINKINSL